MFGTFSAYVMWQCFRNCILCYLHRVSALHDQIIAVFPGGGACLALLAPPTPVNLAALRKKTSKMAEKESGSASAAGIQSEEDLQRMIDQEAWYDSDDEAGTRRLETDSDPDPDPNSYCSEVRGNYILQSM